MIKYILPLAIIITLQGCKQSKLNRVSYMYQACEGKDNVGIKLDSDGVYRCINSKHQVNQIFRTVPKAKKTIKKSKKVSNKCETTITEIFTSKASGSITLCKGKLLEPGQKTRIIRVNK